MNMNSLESYIIDRKVDTRFAEHLRAMEQGGRNEVMALIDRLSPSANALRGLLRLAEEIAMRDKQSLAQVLGDESVRMILMNDKLGRKDSHARIVSLLEMKRYPERALLQTRIDKNVKQLVKEFGIQVHVPDELEGDTVQITLKARSCDELSEKIDSLSELGQHPACRELYSILLGDE
jgi:hypothetical protein